LTIVVGLTAIDMVGAAGLTITDADCVVDPPGPEQLSV
jgi:hypothetical protein